MDLIRGSSTEFRLLSPSAQGVLKDGGFSGWSTYPVEIDPNGIRGSVEGYVGLAVTGRCGRIQKELARQELRVNPAGRTVLRPVGMYFTPETWDGSDIFMSEDGNGFIFVTDRVRKALTTARLTNMDFTPMSEYEWLA